MTYKGFDKKVADAILEYLLQRPWAEVAQIMDALRAEGGIQEWEAPETANPAQPEPVAASQNGHVH